MKKILLTFMLVVAAMTAKAVTATIYVEADKAPYLYSWYNTGGRDIQLLGKWPGTLMSETAEVQGRTFWKMQLSTPANIPAFHIIFNDGGTNGDGNGAKQTTNISNITTDRYFTYDGANKFEDISDAMGVVVPDAEITSVALLSDVYGNWDVNAKFFTEVEKNKTYQTVVDLTNVDMTEDEECFFFEIFVNGSAYLGYSALTLDDPNEWMEEDKGNSGDNILIDLDAAGTRIFLITASWQQGKYIEDNWTLRVEDGTGMDAISDVHLSSPASSVRYNLSGQKVSSSYRGVIVTNGKKLIVK